MGPRRRYDIIVADELTDPRPRHPSQVKQADAPVTEVMRRELGYARGDASAGKRGAQTIPAKSLERQPAQEPGSARAKGGTAWKSSEAGPSECGVRQLRKRGAGP